MTDLDLTVPHVLVGAHKIAFASWWGCCTCGEEFHGTSAEEVREAGTPHRLAERERLSKGDGADAVGKA